MVLLKSNLLPLILSGLSLLLSIIALVVAVSRRKVKHVNSTGSSRNSESRSFETRDRSQQVKPQVESSTKRDNNSDSFFPSGGISKASTQTATHTPESNSASKQVNELGPQQESTPTSVEPQVSIAVEAKPSITKRYAPIPEDNRIKAYDIQIDGEGDSFIEIDFPVDAGVGYTSYRFNVRANHQFIISQGIDRLDNAFAFTKPTSQKVIKILALVDGTLVKDADSWKIEQKARIEFK